MHVNLVPYYLPMNFLSYLIRKVYIDLLPANIYPVLLNKAIINGVAMGEGGIGGNYPPRISGVIDPPPP